MPEQPHKPLTLLPGPSAEASEGVSAAERRSDVRYAFTAAAEVLHLRSQARVAGRISDLGMRGCYVDTLSPFEEGAVVRLRMQYASQEFEAIAVVAYASAPMGMGLAFTDIRPEYQEVLNAWVAKLSGKEPSAEPFSEGNEGSKFAAVENIRQVLKDLIKLMVRKKILSEIEGAELLRQMSR